MVDNTKQSDEEVLSFKCRVITPLKSVFDGEITDLTAIGASGEFELQPRHEPFLSPLKVGIMHISELTADGDDKVTTLAVHGGFLDMNGEEVTVYANSAERADEIDLERARAAKKRAQELLESVSVNQGEDSPIDIDRAQLSLMRAVLRIQMVESLNN